MAHDKHIEGNPNLHMLAMFVLLFVFWLLLSGTLETKFLLYGLATAAIATYATYPVLLIPAHGGATHYFLFGVSPLRFAQYFFWLMWQLILANLDVIKATVRPEIAINPRVVKFRYHQTNPMANLVLANSITLTPGTVTMNVEDDRGDGWYLFEIHALTDGAAEGIEDGGMQRKVAWLFDEPCQWELVKEGAICDSIFLQ